jgi:hypothetical protein
VQERRTGSEAVASERRHNTRRKVQRRRQIDPTTCERDYSVEEIEFMRAMDEYKRASGRMFPTCSEVLEVVRSLGYVQGRIPPGTPASDPLVPLPPAEPAPSEQETAGPC